MTGQENRPSGIKFLAAIGTVVLLGAAIASSRGLQPAQQAQESDVPAHTTKAIAAADKFLQSLDDTLRAKASLDYDSAANRARWSNLPGVPRNGVRMGELTKEQRAAAMDLVAAVTSKEGYQKILDIIAGDDLLAQGGGKGPKGGKGKDDKGKDDKGKDDKGKDDFKGKDAKSKGGKGKGGKGGGGFGFDNFFLAVLGKPSTKDRWLVQFGGHHLALNITVIGKDFVLTPTLTCAQPGTFERDGKTVRPLGIEVDTASKLMGTLNDAQRAQAILKPGVSDLQLGPGRDGVDLKAVGLKGADMTEEQRALLVDLAGAWVTILHESSSKPRMDQIKADIKETYFAWSGPTAPGSAAYFRVQGPTVVIEFAPQQGLTHIHTIVRELGNDYGKKLLSARK
jgi:hypothetical protein